MATTAPVAAVLAAARLGGACAPRLWARVPPPRTTEPLGVARGLLRRRQPASRALHAGPALQSYYTNEPSIGGRRRSYARYASTRAHGSAAEEPRDRGAPWPYDPDGTHPAPPESVWSPVQRPEPESSARRELVSEVLRVDHAGERGAVRIYQGQLAVLRGREARATVAEMKATEDVHLTKMEALLAERRVRPTALMPLWDVAGFALGAATAALGREAAMACTVAVEEVIGEHYNDQIRELLARGYGEDDAELVHVLRVNRDEELEHKDTALRHHAEQAPAYAALTAAIKAGCRAAIALTKAV